MSETIQHECGVALVRLRKNLDHYQEHYGHALHGFRQLTLLLEKQRNRGQDGAGVGCVKLGMPPGKAYLTRERKAGRHCITRLWRHIHKQYQRFLSAHGSLQASQLREKWGFGGQILLGHLRYSTSGTSEEGLCQPYLRSSSWPTRTLLLAGNFNLTNTQKLQQHITRRGAHPIFGSDTQAIMEELGHHLDENHIRHYRALKGTHQARAITEAISRKLDIAAILKKALTHWDGGYAISGVIGNGTCFAFRDAHGIRPLHYWISEDFVAVASERVALATTFECPLEDIRPVEPGHVLVVSPQNEVENRQIQRPRAGKKACSFERIYFSRGNDPDIYRERKALGAALARPISKRLSGDFKHSVFGFIPNTAEIAYQGFMEALHLQRLNLVKESLLKAKERPSAAELDALLFENRPRGEKIAHKDEQVRTFISGEKEREHLVAQVYDVTYGQVNERDTLVCIDDSIVRGTTLKQSILHILSRLKPRGIIIGSTAPQIRYPDCYGIDMSELGKFVAFQALIALLKESGKSHLIKATYQKCLKQRNRQGEHPRNYLKELYALYSVGAVSEKIGELVRPANAYRGKIDIVFQSIQDLHRACHHHKGDWYFTGNYPTNGGYEVLNQAFINYYESRSGRSYEAQGP